VNDLRLIFTKNNIERYFLTMTFMNLVQYASFEDYFGQKNKEMFKDFCHHVWERISSGKLSNGLSISGFRLFSFINTH